MMIARLTFVLFSLALLPARAEPPADLRTDVPLAPVETAMFGCRRVETMEVEEVRRLGRFAALPEHFEPWRERNCWPAVLDDDRLQAAPNAYGTVVTIGERLALVTGIDPDWILRCPERRGLRPRLTRVTGSDLLAVKQRIAATPGLGTQDVLELGFSRAEAGDTNLFALHVGTRERSARIECFDDFQELLDKAADALAGAR
jgi:hypothetical protein